MGEKATHSCCSTLTLDGKVEPDLYSDNTVILVKRGVMEGEECFLR